MINICCCMHNFGSWSSMLQYSWQTLGILNFGVKKPAKVREMYSVIYKVLWWICPSSSFPVLLETSSSNRQVCKSALSWGGRGIWTSKYIQNSIMLVAIITICKRLLSVPFSTLTCVKILLFVGYKIQLQQWWKVCISWGWTLLLFSFTPISIFYLIDLLVMTEKSHCRT